MELWKKENKRKTAKRIDINSKEKGKQQEYEIQEQK